MRLKHRPFSFNQVQQREIPFIKNKLFQMSEIQGRTMKCPFDPSHVMPYDRFLNHLDKCKFQDKKSYAKCKYNPYHVIHKDLISSHQSKCEDRKKFQEESDEDDWAVPCHKPEKSTVSTAVTGNSVPTSSKKKEQKLPSKNPHLHDNSQILAQSFDDYDFSLNRSKN